MTSALIPWLLEAVNGGDVGMVQSGERLRFAFEPRDPLGIGCDGLGKDLDGDAAVQARVGGPVDFTHPPGAEGIGNRIGTEARAGREGQTAGSIAGPVACGP